MNGIKRLLKHQTAGLGKMEISGDFFVILYERQRRRRVGFEPRVSAAA